MNKTYFLIPLLTISMLFFLTNCGGGSSNRERVVVEDSLTIALTPVFKPTIVNVFIDNSGSMRGYVPAQGATAFIDILHDYLTNIELRVADTLNISFISDDVFPLPKEVGARDLRERLRLERFNRPDSDMARMLEWVLPQTPFQTAIFVTDGIFAPRDRANAPAYLQDQQIRIRRIIEEHLSKHPNTAVVVYQLYSQFNGLIWNVLPSGVPINTERPFYIWLIGDAENIHRIKSSTAGSFKSNAVENVFTLLPPIEKDVDYAILNTPRFGSFQRDRNAPQTSIHRIRTERSGIHRGKFRFTVGVDFSPFNAILESGYLTNDYLTDAENYTLLLNNRPTNFFDIEIDNRQTAVDNHTHNLILTTEGIAMGELQILLQRKPTQVPQWVFDITDSDGRSNMRDPDNPARRQTFGLKYMVSGVHDAFQRNQNDTYTRIKLNLNR